MNLKPLRLITAIALGAGMLAACSGSQTSTGSAIPAAPTTLQAQNQNGQGNQGNQGSGGGAPGCQEGNMRIDPCRVTFDSNNPGPTTVTVGRQGNRDQITERDDCATSGIATVTQAGKRTFTVTAGTTAGSCTAHFSDGGGQGNGAKLPITNNL